MNSVPKCEGIDNLEILHYDLGLTDNYQCVSRRYMTTLMTIRSRHYMTAAERAAWDVPPLAEQRCKAEDANRYRSPMPESEANAPAWFKAVWKKWRDEPDR